MNSTLRPHIQFEALEPRVLFDAAPEVTVSTSEDLTVADDQFVNDDVQFEIEFDNVGDATGYAPFVDFVAPPELEIKSVQVYGGQGENPNGPSIDPIGMIAADGQVVDITTGVPVNHPMFLTSIGSPASGYYGGAGSGTPPVQYDVAANPNLIGQYVYSVELPFGSFTEANFPARVLVTAGLDTADGVLPNQSYTLTASGGFALGQDALDNPGTVTAPVDAPLYSALSVDTVYPYVVDLLKTASVYEGDGPYTGEVPSGPNFPITYTLSVNIAAGETITNLVIEDFLPDDLSYTGNLTVSFGAGTSGPRNVTIVDEPAVNTDLLTGTPAADNRLRIIVDSVTGMDPNAGASVIVTYTAFVPYREPSGALVIDATGGEENDLDPEYNDASVSGTWNGNAVGDDAGPLPGYDEDGVMGEVETDYIIEEHSIAIQKGVALLGDQAVSGVVNPRDVLEYTMNFQISDYFAFTDVVVDDLLGDGQDFLPGDGSNVAGEPLEIVPTLGFTMDGVSIAVSFGPGNFTWVENLDGTTSLHFDVYQQLIDSGFITAGDALRGGFIPASGILPADLASINGGATQGTITYRVQVRESYTSGSQQQLSQGDSLDNSVTISGTNRDITTFAALATVSDDSGSSIDIPVGSLAKIVDTVYSHGSIIPFGDDNDESTPPLIGVAPGDLVTYRITYTLPLSEFENLRFEDFLPLPIFDVSSLDDSQIYEYDPVLSYTTAGRISWGLDDTFVGKQGPDVTGDGGIDDNPGYNPTTSITASIDKTSLASTNGFVIEIGSYHPGDGNDSLTTTVVLLVTVPVIDGDYADRLFFTNQVTSSEQNTPGTVSETDEIAQIILVEPELTIKKGVTAVDNPGGTFTRPTGPAGVTFQAPGSGVAFTGNINSDALYSELIDSDLTNVDAGDTVTFFIVVENTGTSQYGAFDVAISDTIPAGFAIPGSGANLRVTYGDGTAIAYTGDLFTTPLSLTDPAVDQGAIEQYSATSGRNVVVIAYDLIVETATTSNLTLWNQAEIVSYAASEGGFDQAEDGELTDWAYVTTQTVGVAKTIIDTSHDDAANTDVSGEVAIGEVVTYQVTFTIPEGTLYNARLIDTLPAGMAFVGIDSVTASPAITFPGGIGDVVGYFNAAAGQLQMGYAAAGVPGLGDIVNIDTDNSTDETVVVTYRAVVLNAASNQAGSSLANDAEIRWIGDGIEQVSESSVSALVVEPDVIVTKTVVGSVTTVEGADEITYRIRIENRNSGPNVSEAYNVTLSDLLPADVSYVAASLIWNGSGVAPNAASLQLLVGGPEGEIVASWSRLGVGEFSEIEVTVRIDDALATDTVITNTANVQFTSLPGAPGDAGYTGFDPASADPDLDFGTGPLNVNLNPAAPVYTTAVERTGDSSDPGGATNDYAVSSPVSVTVMNPTGINKAIIDTSEAHTSQDASASGAVTAAIGEVVRYEVRIRIPQAANSQVELVDTLDPGLLWIDALTNDLEIVVEGFSNPTNLVVSNPAMPPADGAARALDPSLVSFDLVTNQVTFNFGDLTNLETDAGDEFIVIRYNAIVRNDLVNQRGDILTNTVQLREGGANLGSPLTMTLTVVEPSLSITKSDGGVTTADGGDVINYTLTVTASSLANTTTAFEVLVSDTVPDELEIVGGIANVVGLPGTSTVVSNSVTGQDISVLIDRLAPGESFQITFQARVRDTSADMIHAAEFVENTATLAYTGLPGDGTNNGTGDNTTGNESGVPGSESGERDYSVSANDSFTAPAPILTKVLADPADTTFTIGEPVEYVITLTVPEGRSGDPAAYILDTIDPGFRFVPGTLQVTLGSGVTVATAGTLNEANATFFTHTDPGTASSETMRFDFGYVDFQNASAADGLTTGTIEIRYWLQVENIAANQEGDTLNNTADFFYTDADGVTTNVAADANDTDTVITLVEPLVDVTKSIDGISAPEAGGTISYRVVLDHPGDTNVLFNTPAYDVTVTDVLPADVTLQTGTFTAWLNGVTDVSAWFTVSGTGFTDNGTGDIDLAPGDQIVITYGATIGTAVTDGLRLTNEVDIAWTSLNAGDAGDGIDPGDTGERTGDGTGPNDYIDAGNATTTVDLTPSYSFTKAIVSTTADHTGTAAGGSAAITDLVIGEMVTYQLTAQMGRGTTNGVVIEDILALSNGVLDIRDVRIEVGGALSVTLPVPSITDTNADGFFDRVLLNFGTVVNDPSLFTGLADEQIRIFIDAVAVNVFANQDGDVINNLGSLTLLEDTDGDGLADDSVVRTDNVDVEIVEPTLTVDKTIVSAPADPEAGSVVSYQIVVTNTSLIDAFDSTFDDTLPAKMPMVSGTFLSTLSSPDLTRNGMDVSSWFTVTAGSITHSGTGFELRAGESITIRYEAEIQATVFDGENLTNDVDIAWTSLDSNDAADGADATDTDERTGNGTGANDYGDTASETVVASLTPVYDFTKTIVSTTADHTGNLSGTDPSIEDLVIGEMVTYQLTAQMGRGTTQGVVIEDILALTNGILDIRAVRIEVGAALTLTLPTPSITDSNLDTYRDQVLLNFGTVVNNPAVSTGVADEQIRVFIDAVVVNILDNQDGDVVNNTATLTLLEDTDGDGNADDTVVRSASVDVEIVEPSLTVSKTISSAPVNPDAGDSVSYQIVIENTSGVDAFDVTFQDYIPAQLSLVSFTATRASDSADVTAFFTANASGIGHAGGGFFLAAGDSIVIGYDVEVLTTVTDGQRLVNFAAAEWTSLDSGNPADGSDADDSEERSGDGNLMTSGGPADPDDYEAGDIATLTANISPLHGFDKTIFSTSESHTGTAYGTDPSITDLVVGETVTYQLTAQIGRGTTHGVVIEDILALTNGILDIRDVRIEIGDALTVTVPAPTITDSNLDTYLDRVLLNFGTVVNDPALSTGAADEQIRIFIDAVVVNILDNQDGDVINNAASLTVLEDTDGDGDADDAVVRTANVDVEIVEPTLMVDKSITAVPANPDAGDTVTYQIVITNTGDIDAFDVTFLDELPAKVALDAGSFTAYRDSDGADVSGFFTLTALGAGADTLSHAGTGFTLQAGDFIRLVYNVTILPSIQDGDRQTNLVDLEWTTTPGANADERGGDGDYDSPAGPVDPNDHEAESETTFVANLLGYDFDKSVYDTSQSHTGSAMHDPANVDLTIGETVTYALTATFAEGTTPFVTISDIFDLSQGILDIESVTISAGSNLSSSFGDISLLAPSFVDSNSDGYEDQMYLGLGNITNSAADTSDPAADQLTIYITARVVNIVENRDGDQIDNEGVFTYSEDINDDGVIDGADTPTELRDTERVELVEPSLTIDKAVNNPTPKLAETLTYTLTITNDSGSGTADAFDIDVLDELPDGLSLDLGSIQLIHLGSPANPTSITADTSDPQNIRLLLDRLDLGESIQIVYEATVTSDIAYYMAVLPNEADLEWTSTPGDIDDERGGDGDPTQDADPSTEPNFYDDHDSESVEVHQPDLRIVKTDGGVQIRPGQPVVYSLTVTNQGRATALEVSITDDISYYLSNGFVFGGASDGGSLGAGGIVTWSLPDMLVDDEITVTLTLVAPSVIPAGLETIQNTAVAHQLDIEPSPADNRSTDDTPVNARPDLIVSKSDGLTQATVGDIVTYSISYDNVGNQVASGVVIRDTLPPGVRFISASHGGRLRGGTVVWEIGTLRPRDGETVRVTVEILTAGLKVNTVTIEDDGRGGPDPTPRNNRATDTTLAERGLAFDLNQNFLFGRGNQAHHGLPPSRLIHAYSWREQIAGRYPDFEFIRDTRIPIVLATHMNSGLAQPGSTITLEVYNDRGEQIAEQSVVADTGGNWLATFATDSVHEQPARIVMKQTWSTPNVGADTGYNFRTYFAPTFSTATYYTEDLSIWNVTGKRSATEVIDLYKACESVLVLDWNGTTYEFHARGGMQSSSGN